MFETKHKQVRVLEYAEEKMASQAWESFSEEAGFARGQKISWLQLHSSSTVA